MLFSRAFEGVVKRDNISKIRVKSEPEGSRRAATREGSHYASSARSALVFSRSSLRAADFTRPMYAFSDYKCFNTAGF